MHDRISVRHAAPYSQTGCGVFFRCETFRGWRLFSGIILLGIYAVHHAAWPQTGNSCASASY